MSMLEGGHVFASDDAAATVMAAGSVANGEIDDDNPAAAAMVDTILLNNFIARWSVRLVHSFYVDYLETKVTRQNTP